MEEILRVGYNRLAVIIGHNGKVKRDIERKTKTKLKIDTTESEVTISSDGSFFEVYLAKNIVSAISRGFSPENAFKLLNNKFSLEIIDIDDFVKHSKQRHVQIKGRVIGREGRIKQIIEKKYNCILSIYGKTVSIIGDENRIKKVRENVEKILSGAKHSTILKSIKRDSILEDYSAEKEDVKKSEGKIDDISFD